ncbi:hypothetical protein QYF61_022890 [Mycteria americana]|uniref:Uncharacterized protein n=1 Tax=Mycteria americana TaxID=33587 RepID=A0AAN7MVA3_MYCAM|nr:hypothetical protein QYF61_022890 [Mycteria americana]
MRPFRNLRGEAENSSRFKFNKEKRKVMHLGKHKPGVQHRLGSTRLGSSSVERDPGVLVDNQLNMSEQCAAVAKKANRMLGCTNKSITSRDKEALSHSTQHLSGHTWNTVFSFGPRYAKKMWTGWRGSREGPQR